jgi:hypothetical protein
VYGVGYRHAPVDGEAAFVAPRIGAGWSRGDWVMRGLLSYHAVVSGSPQGRAESLATGPLGYEADLRAPLGPTARFEAGARHAPVQFDDSGCLPGDDNGGVPLYLSDGNAVVSESRLALVDDAGGTRARLELASGHTSGRVTTLLPFSGTYDGGSEARMHYRSGRFELGVPASGTQLGIEYRRTAVARGEPVTAAQAQDEWLEVRVRQRIRVAPLPGEFRVLLALRVGSIDDERLEAWERAGGDMSTLEALNRRMSAGVSVLF